MQVEGVAHQDRGRGGTVNGIEPENGAAWTESSIIASGPTFHQNQSQAVDTAPRGAIRRHGQSQCRARSDEESACASRRLGGDLASA